MITEKPKINNELLANSAKQYIESASYNQLTDLICDIKSKLIKSFKILGFWGCVVGSDGKMYAMSNYTYADSELEKLLLLGTLEEAKNFIHQEYNDIEDI